MSDRTFHLEIVTPRDALFAEDAESVEIPGSQGEFQILRGHTPFLTDLDIGPVTVSTPEGKRYFSISGGYCEVLPEKTTILAHAAEMSNQIDVARAEEAQKRAENRLDEAPKNEDIDEARANAALKRALNRLNVAKMIS